MIRANPLVQNEPFARAVTACVRAHANRTTTMPITRFLRGALVCTLPFLLLACASQPPESETQTQGMRTQPIKGRQSMSPALADAAQRALTPGLPSAEDKARIFKGTGVLVKGQQPGGGLPPGQPVQPVGNGVVLNFEGADLREVVRNILGDILGEAYTIDASVGGTVTIRTAAGIPREALPAMLEMLLRMNGSAMVKEGGIYKIVPQAAAIRGNITPQLGNSQRALPPGFSVQIVPLRYVGVREMVRILEPFAKEATAVRPDDLRNLLILSGTELELKHLLDTIDMFDVDWMSGMSVGLFTLQYADVKTVMQELDKAIGDKATSPLVGILRIIPLERLNALLIITPQPAYIEEAKKWIARLDQGGTGDGPSFYVYYLQNQRAEKLGPLLTQAFTGRAAPAAAPSAPTVAPGTPAGTIVSPPTFQAQPSVVQPTINVTTTPATPPPNAANPAGQGARTGEGLGIVRNVQVVADKDNNTLLIVATAQEYQIIEAALKKLDVPPRQVAIEVTIASVTLKDELDFGVEWLFKGGAPSGRGSGGNLTRSTPFNPAVPLAAAASTAATAAVNPGLALAQGFYYIINNSNFPGGVQAALHLLDSYGDTKVIANPHLAALDNQKATIKAGDKIPINQQSVVGSTTNVVTTTSQYIDTGVLLQVTPHINQGGLVTLDVQAEVSDPGTVANPGDAPPINTRSIQTIVNVQSGQTMVMGGLIGETKQNTSNGLPLLSRIPVIGGLFGNQALVNNRTELVMFITPRVVETELDLKNVVDDLRRRMEKIDDSFDVFKRAQPVKAPATSGNY
jgi:general secretion pathway protein D